MGTSLAELRAMAGRLVDEVLGAIERGLRLRWPQRLALVCLAENANVRDRIARLSIRRVARRTGMGVHTAWHAMRALRAVGLIEPTTPLGAGRRVSWRLCIGQAENAADAGGGRCGRNRGRGCSGAAGSSGGARDAGDVAGGATVREQIEQADEDDNRALRARLERIRRKREEQAAPAQPSQLTPTERARTTRNDPLFLARLFWCMPRKDPQC